MYLIQKHKVFIKIAKKNLKGHHKIKKKKWNDIFITQLARLLKRTEYKYMYHLLQLMKDISFLKEI